ncbi:Alginate lyase [Fusarium keratoplasticum]|nr:Alginate lyase [Fusarium keratoplasticum]
MLPFILLYFTFYLSTLVYAQNSSFVHPGLLHTQADFDRIAAQVAKRAEPWITGFDKLAKNPHSQLSWNARHAELIYRGKNPIAPQNYAVMFRDAAAAYALAIRWKASGDVAYAEKAVEILDSWISTLTAIHGSADRFLAAGLQGYQFANAAEILRTYKNWPPEKFDAAVEWLNDVFYPLNHRFLTTHNDARIDNYWANWDLSTLASILSIGILSDNRTMYNEAVDYFKTGRGNGAIEHAIWYVHGNGTDSPLGQVQESGRDQGHTMMCLGLLATIAQTTYNQGDDFFAYLDNRILAASEYVARYNLGEDVPYEPLWTKSHGWNRVIGSGGRGGIRPIWEIIYNHYAKLKGLDAPYTKRMVDKIRAVSGGAEGGGGDYAAGSGGYDALGYGTLLFSLP